MPTRLTLEWPETTLYRILWAFERELLTASDEEIMDAARDLGMNPAMKGSAAFAGLKYPVVPRLSDFYDLEAWQSVHTDEPRTAFVMRRPMADVPEARPATVPRQRKGPSDK